jgi:hypothetical protein
MESPDEATCPDDTVRSEPIPIVDNNIDPDLRCSVHRTLCYDHDCEGVTGNETIPVPVVRVNVTDGPVQISYPYAEED